MPGQIFNNIDVRAGLVGALSIDYTKLDEPISSLVRQSIRYNDWNFVFLTGDGDNRVNVLYTLRDTIQANVTRVFDLNNLEDVYGNRANFASLKFVLVRNRNTDINLHPNSDGDCINAFVKTESWCIGPQGSRFLVEPLSRGLNAQTGESHSGETGSLQISNGNGSGATANNSPIEYDLIILGSEYDQSSSTSGI